MKVCAICQQEKPLSEFHKQSTGNRGVMSHCKVCRRAYTRTIPVKARGTYNTLRKSQTMGYTVDEFVAWCKISGAYIRQHRAWSDSDFDKECAPTVIRINVQASYTLDNLKVVAWAVSNRKHRDGSIAPLPPVKEQAVLHLATGTEYPTITEAAEKTGISACTITVSCNWLKL